MKIIKLTAHFPGRYLAGFSPQVTFSSYYQFHFSVFRGLCVEFNEFVGYLYIFWQSIFQDCRIMLTCGILSVFRETVHDFLSVCLSDSKCMSTSGYSSSPCNSFSMLLNHSAFLFSSFRFHILLQIKFASVANDCWFVLVHSLPTGY